MLKGLKKPKIFKTGNIQNLSKPIQWLCRTVSEGMNGDLFPRQFYVKPQKNANSLRCSALSHLFFNLKKPVIMKIITLDEAIA